MGRVLASIVTAALMGCATSAPFAPPSALRGCWIEHRGADAVTMRWFPSANGSWRGDMLTYSAGQPPAHQAFNLDPTAGESEHAGWAICPQEDGLPHGAPCRAAFFKTAHMSGEGADWMELHADAQHLRFVYRTGPDTLVLFDGARDGCD